MTSEGSMTVAGWYPDPWRTAPLRWWDGTAWTGYLSAGTTTSKPVPQLDLVKERDHARQAHWAAILMAIGQLLTLVVFAVMADGIVSMVRFISEHPTSEEVPPGLGQLTAAGSVSALVSPLSLIGVILLLIWLHRAVTNGIALGYRPPRDAALAVVSWFIPIVNFWWPYESLRECVSPSDTATRALIKRWWLVYLAAGFGALVVAPFAVLWLPLGVVLGAVAVSVVVYEARLTRKMVSSVLASHTAAEPFQPRV